MKRLEHNATLLAVYLQGNRLALGEAEWSRTRRRASHVVRVGKVISSGAILAIALLRLKSRSYLTALACDRGIVFILTMPCVPSGFRPNEWRGKVQGLRGLAISVSAAKAIHDVMLSALVSCSTLESNASSCCSDGIAPDVSRKQ